MNKGQFKKGHKMLSGSEKGWIKKGERLSPKTEFKKGLTDDKSISWKGDRAGYVAKHIWVAKHLGKPHFCEHCGRRDLKHRQYNWANVSGRYKRILSDWIRLCSKCHMAYDKK